MRHSPWPWRVEGVISPEIRDANGAAVALLHGDRRNVRLIAHAPDLLAFVRRVHRAEEPGEWERLRNDADDLIRDCGEVP
jgi:hypothetical protein